MRRAALALSLTCLAQALSAASLGSYAQSLEIIFESRDAARRAGLETLPRFHGYEGGPAPQPQALTGCPQAGELDSRSKAEAQDPRWAYEQQFLQHSLNAQRAEKSLYVTLVRPDPLDLNSMVPLSFVLRGVKADEVQAVRAIHAQAKRFKGTVLGYTFDMPHDNGRAAPVSFGAEAMGVEAGLSLSGTTLLLSLKNTSASALEKIRVCFRLAGQEGDLAREWAGGLEPGESKDVDITLEKPRKQGCYQAQIDALSSGRALRAFAVTAQGL